MFGRQHFGAGCQSREAWGILKRDSKKTAQADVHLEQNPTFHSHPSVVWRRGPHAWGACRLHLVLAAVGVSVTARECLADWSRI